MCLAIPGRIVEIVDEASAIARADVRGALRTISYAWLKDEGVAVNDWVLIHVGSAIRRIEEREAREAENFWAEATRLLDGSAGGDDAWR